MTAAGAVPSMARATESASVTSRSGRPSGRRATPPLRPAPTRSVASWPCRPTTRMGPVMLRPASARHREAERPYRRQTTALRFEPFLAHRADKWTRFSALNDAQLSRREHRMDPKSGFHFWVRCSRSRFRAASRAASRASDEGLAPALERWGTRAADPSEFRRDPGAALTMGRAQSIPGLLITASS